MDVIGVGEIDGWLVGRWWRGRRDQQRDAHFVGGNGDFVGETGARPKFPLSSGHRREPDEPGRKILMCPRLGATLVCSHDEVRFSEDADAHERSRLLYFYLFSSILLLF